VTVKYVYHILGMLSILLFLLLAAEGLGPKWYFIQVYLHYPGDWKQRPAPCRLVYLRWGIIGVFIFLLKWELV